jgi:hypothetical protein
MAGKKDLASMLGTAAAQPKIRRGEGVRLSTEIPAAEPEAPESQNRTSAISHKRTPASVKRVNRGYKLREDLIKDLRRIALDEDKALYEVMELALEEYVTRYRAKGKKSLDPE